jgi:hypothetical protein
MTPDPAPVAALEQLVAERRRLKRVFMGAVWDSIEERDAGRGIAAINSRIADAADELSTILATTQEINHEEQSQRRDRRATSSDSQSAETNRRSTEGDRATAQNAEQVTLLAASRPAQEVPTELERLRAERDEAKAIIQAACDRSWENETLLESASIASNAIYYRDRSIALFRAEIKRLTDLLKLAAPEATEATREALEDMVYQFGHDCVKGGQPAIGTGGLSALEGAFAVLGWEDPYVIPDPVWCDAPVEPRCPNRVSCGTPTPDGYKQFCHDHFHLWQAAQRPSVADSSMAPSRVGGNTKQSSDLGESAPPEPQP